MLHTHLGLESEHRLGLDLLIQQVSHVDVRYTELFGQHFTLCGLAGSSWPNHKHPQRVLSVPPDTLVPQGAPIAPDKLLDYNVRVSQVYSLSEVCEGCGGVTAVVDTASLEERRISCRGCNLGLGCLEELIGGIVGLIAQRGVAGDLGVNAPGGQEFNGFRRDSRARDARSQVCEADCLNSLRTWAVADKLT